MSTYGRLMCQIGDIERHPAMHPMSPLVSMMTTAGGFMTGLAIVLVVHGRPPLALASVLIAALLVTPLLTRTAQRRRIRHRLDSIRAEAHSALDPKERTP